MSYSALIGDYADYPRTFIAYSPDGKSRVRKHYMISPDSNGNGVDGCYYGGGENPDLLQICPGNYWTDIWEIQRYLDCAGLPNVKFIEELPV